MLNKIRIVFSCTGIGTTNRGIESFFQEAYDNLRDVAEIDAHVVKGVGNGQSGERVARMLRRDGAAAKAIGKLSGRSAYAIEQWSSLCSVYGAIRECRADIVFYSEANLGFGLRSLRSVTGRRFVLLFSNGAPLLGSFARMDLVHQVAPTYLREALAAGEDPRKHMFVPYGFKLSRAWSPPTRDEKIAIRQRLGLPTDRQILISVGWISHLHKRMDYLVQELAACNEPRPFLVMLGWLDPSSPYTISLATELLGAAGFVARSVPLEEVNQYYRASDYFVLGSLKEGFGRVFIEALAEGLPIIAHDHSVMRFVLGDQAELVDLSRPGTLSALISRNAELQEDAGRAIQRRRYVESNFSWTTLRPKYVEMFEWAKASMQRAEDEIPRVTSNQG
jgi:1,2-diacylglycerol 3-alpha-glucosyltransferase